MAPTSAGSSGSTWGRNRPTTSPVGETRNFSKFHVDVAGLAVGVGHGGQLVVDRVSRPPR